MPVTPVMLAASPAITASLPTPPSTGQANGPRPNRDPGAIPDGAPAGTSTSVVSINLSVVSDYRLRGISQSGGHAAVQGSVEGAAPSGVYAGIWASTIAPYEGAHSEVDMYGGYRTTTAGIDVDAGLISFFYPGADGVSSAEAYISGARNIGSTSIKAGVSFTPHQGELGPGDGLYLFAEAETPLPRLPVTLRGHIGRETGVNTIDGAPKIDWLAGADIRQGHVTWSAAWVAARYRFRRSQQDSRDRIVIAISLDL